MHIVEWEFLPAPDFVAEFLAAYGPDGSWGDLFRRAEGYLGTELTPIAQKPGWFRALDRWQSPAAYAAFRRDFAAEYRRLDVECEQFTAEEIPGENASAVA